MAGKIFIVMKESTGDFDVYKETAVAASISEASARIEAATLNGKRKPEDIKADVEYVVCSVRSLD